jgi:hypothetical protein
MSPKLMAGGGEVGLWFQRLAGFVRQQLLFSDLDWRQIALRWHSLTRNGLHRNATLCFQRPAGIVREYLLS